MVEVALADLREVVALVLHAHDVDPATTAVLVDYVTDAEAAGRRTHGLQRLSGMLAAIADQPLPAPIEVQPVSPGLIEVHGHGQLGIVVAQRCTDAAIDEARRAGSAMVVATGFVGSTGALGYFAGQAALQGLLTLVLASCESGVAAEGGVEPVLGTNPLALSFPHEPAPVTIDIATSAVSYGTLEQLASQGLPAPPSTVIDAAGRPSTDPRDAVEGAQLPMAGHKGYGLGLLIELIAGPMIGGKAGRDAVPGSDGLVVLATRVDHFRPRDHIVDETTRLLTQIRSGRRQDPDVPIRVPGERSERSRLMTEGSGRVSLDAALWFRTRRLAGLDG